MPTDDFKYDVAISFLYEDAALAKSLSDKLSDGLDVFFFPRNQEELAGTDGLESMRKPFRDESRLNVVLYRRRWGKTPWTGVEEAAIKDSCLATSFKSLFFFVIESPDEFPTWLPETNVRFNYSDFTLDQAVGAIKMRVQERGGHYKPLTPLRKAELLRAAESYRQDRRRLSSSEGIQRILKNVDQLFETINMQCKELTGAGDLDISCVIDSKPNNVIRVCLLGERRVGMSVTWSQRYINTLENSGLFVREFSQNLIIPPGYTFLEQPTKLRETVYEPELSLSREYGWRLQAKGDSFISSNRLSEMCLLQLLELVEKDRAGKIKRKGWA